MARYIDADELYRETEKKIKANHECRMAVVDDEFLDLINDAFTEDVVPRSTINEIFALIWDAFQSTYYDSEFEEKFDKIEKKYVEEKEND